MRASSNIISIFFSVLLASCGGEESEDVSQTLAGTWSSGCETSTYGGESSPINQGLCELVDSEDICEVFRDTYYTTDRIFNGNTFQQTYIQYSSEDCSSAMANVVTGGVYSLLGNINSESGVSVRIIEFQIDTFISSDPVFSPSGIAFLADSRQAYTFSNDQLYFGDIELIDDVELAKINFEIPYVKQF
ncbi:MAG: hypothetical protein JKY67_21785 [Pseudomonadales bacterium]|nr:hypothetical protein [Pseudomonadales bacterium]MBL4869005.1 hypothetical protein [Pseudomonadales bacterium]